MPLARLTLTDFRSHAAVTLAPGPGFVVLTGDNGAGKTNVLEAISLLAPGRGLRAATLGDMARRDGPGGFGVAAQLGDVALGTGTIAAAPERRIVRINGATATASALGEWLSIVWLTPAQDRLFVDTAGARRRFFDRLVLALDPGHAHDTARYEAAMRQRTRLLADARLDEGWLRALEAAMALHGTAIADRRAALASALSEALATQPPSPFARAGLTLEGYAAGDLATVLQATRARDAAAGRALTGPHRQDLTVMHRDKAMPAASSSTGEQKALLIGIILAHADLVAARQQRRPILLLDEVAAHLDGRRRAALFERLRASGGQIWMTGTDAAPFTSIEPPTSRFRLADGAVAAL